MDHSEAINKRESGKKRPILTEMATDPLEKAVLKSAICTAAIDALRASREEAEDGGRPGVEALAALTCS